MESADKKKSIEEKIKYSICGWKPDSTRAVLHEVFTSDKGVLSRYMEIVNGKEYVMVVLREERKGSAGSTSTIIAEWKNSKDFVIHATRKRKDKG